MKISWNENLIEVECKCCKRIYKTSPLSNACKYSFTPGYGCDECKGEKPPSKEEGFIAD